MSENRKCKWCQAPIVRGITEREGNFKKRIVCRKGTDCYKRNVNSNISGWRTQQKKNKPQHDIDMELTRAEAEKSRQEALRRGLGFDKGRILPRDEINRLIAGGKITPICCISSNHLLPYGSDVGGGYGT